MNPATISISKGTVIIISHDRELLENVVTRSLVFQGDGKFVDVAGGWSDFERERSNSTHLKPVFETDFEIQTPTKDNDELAMMPSEKLSSKLKWLLLIFTKTSKNPSL